MASLSLLLVLFVAGVRANGASGSGYCSIFPQDLSDIPPLVLSDEPDGGFLYSETSNREIRVNEGETIRLACTKKPDRPELNYISTRVHDDSGEAPFKKPTGKDTIVIKCVGHNLFIEDVEVAAGSRKKNAKNKKSSTSAVVSTVKGTEFKNFICDRPNSATIIPDRANRRCGNSNNVKEIVFEISSTGKKYGIIDYCLIRSDAQKQYTAWAHGKIRPYISYNYAAPRGQPTWTNFDASTYVWEQELFKTQDKNTVLKNFKEKGSNRIDRGHLIAYADMYWPSQRNGTFDYVNAVPQWKSINSGNWKKVEEVVRDIATEKGRELDVWVGGIGVMVHDKLELYLQNVQNGPIVPKKVPVPAYLYKMILDKSTNEGIVFVTINNPFIAKNDVSVHVKCNDVSEGIGKMNRARNKDWSNTELGYTFCCTIENFRSKFSNEPVGVTFDRTTLMKFGATSGSPRGRAK